MRDFGFIAARAALLAVCLGFGGAGALAAPITLTSAAGFPNERTVNDVPANVIDGSLLTWTWTTQPNTTASPAYLAIGFGSTTVNHIRLWKDSYDSAGSNSKNLTISYTTDAGALSGRSYSAVSNLTSGINGTELWNGVVAAGGTVGNDVHDSETDGWGSLTFDPVTATGVRIGFANTLVLFNVCNGLSAFQLCNHYRVAEFQAFNSTIESVPEPASLALLTVALLGLAQRRRAAG